MTKPKPALTDSLCPDCQSDNIEGQSFDTWGNGSVTQDCSCNDCDAAWTLNYTLTGITRP